jgi:hypothetical protein
MLSAILSDPFATSQPPLVLAALATLQTTVTICWARLVQPLWRNEILKALVLCWLHFDEEAGQESSNSRSKTHNAEQFQLVKKQLAKTAEMLGAISRAADTDLAKEVAPLVAKEPSLQALFGMS